MLDVHNHVLFGLDDGCRTIEESRLLAAQAKAAGHSGLIATPHIRPGLFDNEVEGIRARRDETRAVVEAEGLELHLGAEYFFGERLLEDARARSLLTLGESSRFVLVEFPSRGFPVRHLDLLYELRLLGYVAVIAHPERCKSVQEKLTKAIEDLMQVGVLLQLDLGSLIGHYGPEAKKAATTLVREGAYHLAACDLHRPGDVDVLVAPSKKTLSRLLSKRGVDQGVEILTVENPKKILKDAEPETIRPV
jgi:protein-tyrosine phosphatase